MRVHREAQANPSKLASSGWSSDGPKIHPHMQLDFAWQKSCFPSCFFFFMLFFSCLFSFSWLASRTFVDATRSVAAGLAMFVFFPGSSTKRHERAWSSSSTFVETSFPSWSCPSLLRLPLQSILWLTLSWQRDEETRTKRGYLAGMRISHSRVFEAVQRRTAKFLAQFA